METSPKVFRCEVSGQKSRVQGDDMVERGADAIALASCISRGNPVDFSCPHYEEMKKSVAKKIRPGIKIIDWTH